jgi:hypothetical protein
LSKETALLPLRAAAPLAPRARNATATILHERSLAGVVAAETAATGWVLALQDKWCCQDRHCRNHPYTCWLPRTAIGVIQRFENHLAVNSNIIAMWSRAIDKQLATVDEPCKDVRLAILKSKDRAEAQKERRCDGDRGGGGDNEMADLMKVYMMGTLRQLTAQIVPPQQPETAVQQPNTPVSPLSLALWVPIEYDHWWEIFEHTVNFFNWFERLKLGLGTKFVREVFVEVFINNRVNVNMLLNNSDNGVPLRHWHEVYGYPTGVLLQLCKQAVKWQKEYGGLTEQQRAAIEAEKEKEEAERDRNGVSLGYFPGFES